jgi:hypothetical protein
VPYAIADYLPTSFVDPASLYSKHVQQVAQALRGWHWPRWTAIVKKPPRCSFGVATNRANKALGNGIRRSLIAMTG